MIFNEVTVRLKCNISEACNILENNGFKIIDKYSINDTYYIWDTKDKNNKQQSIRKLLSKYILIRDIKQYEGIEFKNYYNVIKLTYKIKDIKYTGEIVNQEKFDFEIKNAEDGKRFIETIGYKRLMDIKEDTLVYGKEQLEIAIKNIENEYSLIEIEVVENDEKYNTINKLKQVIKELNIPIDESDFFVKKAENKLKKYWEIISNDWC